MLAYFLDAASRFKLVLISRFATITEIIKAETEQSGEIAHKDSVLQLKQPFFTYLVLIKQNSNSTIYIKHPTNFLLKMCFFFPQKLK